MNQKNIHYFPGHMQKAIREMAPYVKNVDLVVEILDSRAPLSSRNPLLNQIIGQKPRILLLSKYDLSDPKVTMDWVSYFSSQGLSVLPSDLKKDKLVNVLEKAARGIIKAKREKEAKIGMKKQPLRVMVMGIPNVGKSTFINSLARRNAAIVGNKAGVTRAEQWIKLNEDFVLLDTPGVLPMNYLEGEQPVNLALVGSMKEEVLPTEELAHYLLDKLRADYPTSLKDRYGIEDIQELGNDDVLLAISKKRGQLINGGPSITRGSYLIIKEFKDGLLGRISIEKTNA